MNTRIIANATFICLIQLQKYDLFFEVQKNKGRKFARGAS